MAERAGTSGYTMLTKTKTIRCFGRYWHSVPMGRIGAGEGGESQDNNRAPCCCVSMHSMSMFEFCLPATSARGLREIVLHGNGRAPRHGWIHARDDFTPNFLISAFFHS